MLPDLAGLNPLSSMGIGSIGTALLIFFLALLILGLGGVAIWFYIQRKQLRHTIPLYRKVGGQPIKVAVFKAKDFKIGLAGDKLWYVPKAKKYISPATIQTAPNEYPHFEREDGEWINFGLGNIDEIMKKAGVKYVHTDMRSQRIAISNLLEQRFQGKKSWWEKYGHLVTHVIFYMVVMIGMVVIFYQWGDIVERVGNLLQRVIDYENMKCPAQQGVVPAFAPLLLLWRRY
jgi:hypothetical protein